MKALDTNVLVRLLTKDDPRQAKRALDFIERLESAGEAVFISNPVLMELSWVLASAYSYPRESIIAAIEQLSASPTFEFESRELVSDLVAATKSNSLEIADLIIALTARHHRCETTLTFDKRAARSNLFELI